MGYEYTDRTGLQVACYEDSLQLFLRRHPLVAEGGRLVRAFDDDLPPQCPVIECQLGLHRFENGFHVTARGAPPLHGGHAVQEQAIDGSVAEPQEFRGSDVVSQKCPNFLR